MTLLSIDPGRSFKGEATIGYALFNDVSGRGLGRGRLTYDELRGKLSLGLCDDGSEPAICGLQFGVYDVYEVLCEDFVNNEKSRGGQRNGTSECIGMVEDRCWLAGVRFTRQKPDALGPAKLHTPKGSWKDLKHLRHEDSAYLHGYEYLVRKGVLQSAGLRDTL